MTFNPDIEHQPDIEDVISGGLIGMLLGRELEGLPWFEQLTGSHPHPDIAKGALVGEMQAALISGIPEFATFFRAWSQENTLRWARGQKGMEAELTSRLEGALVAFLFGIEEEIDRLTEPDTRPFFDTP